MDCPYCGGTMLPIDLKKKKKKKKKKKLEFLALIFLMWIQFY